MREALYFDHSYHKKTNSTKFIIDLLRNYFNLYVFYDENWVTDKPVKITFPNQMKYLFFCQVLPELGELKWQIKNRKIIWFPMYDAVITGMSEDYLKHLSKLPLRVICFSKTLFVYFQRLGFNCRYFKYYIDPEKLKGKVSDFTKRNIYFWFRRPPITWTFIKKIIGNVKIDSITIKNYPDSKAYKLNIPRKDIKKFNIKIYSDFLPSQKHNKLLNNKNIYIAARPLEGIGISFIEALGRGQCVIAPDSPTMNEHIVDGVNGYLYNLNKPRLIDLSNFETVATKARIEALKGFKRWEKDLPSLVSFIMS